ncbi:hypothetical protein FHU36_004420 [Nonomuraea muscovyensis]|uniref:Uncharacterized protein n=2 Tax=Nonomuraea muscovyensis TaxID=1124761 RepID=A0A7X0C3J0_9ACTN|nr:hypothetical protein [Nonomuraea muscovyensis]
MILVSLLSGVDHAIDLERALAIRAANPTLSRDERQLLDEAVALVNSSTSQGGSPVTP